MPSRRLAVFREPKFLALREILAERRRLLCEPRKHGRPLRRRHARRSAPAPTWSTEPQLLEDLKWFGFNLLSCANSHSLNFGEDGLRLQNRYLDAAGIAHAGTGENLRQASSPAYLDTPNGRVALIAATAHLPSAAESRRQSARRFSRQTRSQCTRLRNDFRRRQGIVCRLCKRLGTSLGFDRATPTGVDHGFHTAAEIGAATQTEYNYRGDRYQLGETFDIRTSCNEDDVEENLRQIREARRQADWVIVSLHNQELIGRSWLTAKKRTKITEQPSFVHDFAHRCIDAGADVFACHGPHS